MLLHTQTCHISNIFKESSIKNRTNCSRRCSCRKEMHENIKSWPDDGYNLYKQQGYKNNNDNSQTSYGARRNPDLSWLVRSWKLSFIWSIEKMRVKLKRICTFCRRNAFCGGLIVIPPGNFSTSKEKGSPNNDTVRRRGYCWTRDTKEPLIKLWVVEETLEFFSSGSTAKTTLVLFDPGTGSKERISTWIEEKQCVNKEREKTRWGEGVDEEVNTRIKIEKKIWDSRYFNGGSFYFIENVTLKSQNIVLQQWNRLLKHETCNHIVIWRIKHVTYESTKLEFEA